VGKVKICGRDGAARKLQAPISKLQRNPGSKLQTTRPLHDQRAGSETGAPIARDSIPQDNYKTRFCGRVKIKNSKIEKVLTTDEHRLGEGSANASTWPRCPRVGVVQCLGIGGLVHLGLRSVLSPHPSFGHLLPWGEGGETVGFDRSKVLGVFQRGTPAFQQSHQIKVKQSKSKQKAFWAGRAGHVKRAGGTPVPPSVRGVRKGTLRGCKLALQAGGAVRWGIACGWRFCRPSAAPDASGWVGISVA
jgi:hypothetical protein